MTAISLQAEDRSGLRMLIRSKYVFDGNINLDDI